MPRKRTVQGPGSRSQRAAGAQRPSDLARSAESATIRRILDGAQAVLIQHGYAGFTTRRVAEAAAMRPGNLSYHFPSKRELLRALIRRLIEEYAQRFRSLLLEPDLPLQSLVQWLLTDAVAEQTVRMFRELWAMALHDAVIRRALDDFYDELMQGVVQLLQCSRPRADVASIREVVQLLALISEGATVVYGTRRERAISLERVAALLPRILQLIAPQL